MPTILSIETATNVCSVAIRQQGQHLISIDLASNYAHAEKLTLFIEDCLRHTHLKTADIDAFAVSMGPGSYTGLRIGSATVKGLCYATNKPLIAINTLEAIAYQVACMMPDNYWLCPMLDARRMEVYCTIYDHQLQIVTPTEAKIIDEHSFEEQLAHKPIVFFGNGAAKCKQILSRNANALFLDQVIHPSAKSVASLAEKAYKQGQFQNIVCFEPFYLKEFVSK